MSLIERPGPRDPTARWQTYADWLEAERAEWRRISAEQQADYGQLQQQLAGAVDLLREARGWVDGHAETGWGAAELVTRIDVALGQAKGSITRDREDDKP